MSAAAAPVPGPATPRRATARMVAGVAGGVGTTTVATALGAVDRGVLTGRGVDVLVCRATAESLIRAGRAAQLLGEDDHRPVLAVTAADPSRPSRAVLARLRLLEPNAAAVVLLPYVPRWRDLPAPLDTVRGLLRQPPAEAPRVLRGYASALRQLAAALGITPTRAAATAAPLTRPAVRRLPAQGRDLLR